VSNFGQDRHPAWYYNLRANPEAEVVVGGVRRRVRAVAVEGPRRAEIWQSAQRVYPGFSEYESRAEHRQIAMFALNPL
jgi:deazaflavin-dependent oxidoreductase (nitroreductase family)